MATTHQLWSSRHGRASRATSSAVDLARWVIPVSLPAVGGGAAAVCWTACGGRSLTGVPPALEVVPAEPFSSIAHLPGRTPRLAKHSPRTDGCQQSVAAQTPTVAAPL